MKLLLPILFVLYYGNIALFSHVHIENGVTIVHSHPSPKALDGSTHKHASLSEIQLFQSLSSIQIADGAVSTLILNFCFQQLCTIKAKPVSPEYIALFHNSNSLRAPPLFT